MKITPLLRYPHQCNME